jgi:glycosyltransferase involved in cell wall biosynthesis
MMPVRVAHITTIDLTLRAMLLPQLRRLREAGFEVTGISAPGDSVTLLEAEGIRHISWPHATRAWHPKADVRAFFELLAILRHERFDIVHTHNPKPGIMGRVAGRLAGVPCVVNTVHGLYATPDDRMRRKAPILTVESLASRFSDVEMYQSEEDLAWALRVGVVARSKGVLLGNGVDVSRFDPAAVPPQRLTQLRRELGIPEDARVVGTVGRLVAEKGFRELFAAARRVSEDHPDVWFLIVGPRDPDKWDALGPEDLEALGDRVVITGWREDVRDLLGLMDVFVLASWREGVPRSAIEAAAMARALVLTDIRGCREVVRHEVEGLLVPVRDAPALTAAITSLLEDSPWRMRLGEAARARAVARFDERRVADKVVDRYRRLLASKGRLLPLPEPVDTLR